MHTLFAVFGLGPMELVVLVVLGVLLFGKNLPSMGRYIGKSIVEFKKGVKGLEDDVEGGAAPVGGASSPQEQQAIRPPQRVAVTAPKFEDVPSPTSNSVSATPPKV